jgi:hypothetical protein
MAAVVEPLLSGRSAGTGVSSSSTAGAQGSNPDSTSSIDDDPPLSSTERSPAEQARALAQGPRTYVWQKDPFHLELSTNKVPPWVAQAARKAGRKQRAQASSTPSTHTGTHGGDVGVPPGQQHQHHPQGTSRPEEGGGFLWGATRWGDNVEDEWMVVHLLMEITRALPNTSARVSRQAAGPAKHHVFSPHSAFNTGHMRGMQTLLYKPSMLHSAVPRLLGLRYCCLFMC